MRLRSNLATPEAAPLSTPAPVAPPTFSNPTIAGIEQADALLIVGSKPRAKEAAVLNARIRKALAQGGQLKIGLDRRQGRPYLHLRLSRPGHGFAQADPGPPASIPLRMC